METSLDIGIEEDRFWDMTVNEIIRRIRSFNRVYKTEQQAKASFIYTLADLIGLSVVSCVDSNCKMPPIEEVFPFFAAENKEELERLKQEKEDKVMTARFLEFAAKHNLAFRNKHSQEVVNSNG